MERVLLVEDELDELELLYWALIGQGSEVRTANTAKGAISLGKYFRPTLLVSDFVLQHGATGLDVLRELRRTNPVLPALIISGLPAAELRLGLEGLEDVEFLQKPFGMQEFLSRLDGMKRAA